MANIDPFTEIRMTTLHATRGANYWSHRPVTYMDVQIGAYEDISSAEVPHCIDQLLAALPGLAAHRCSVGTPGGFVQRLRRGTYAAHIAEHVALELQSMIGHDVGYGRTRGTGVVGEYSLVFEHRHETVGLRTAALALEIVQRALAGTLDSVDPAVAELRSLAETHDVPPLRQHVLCAITGSVARDETREALARHNIGTVDAEGSGEALVVTVSPMYILQAGLPYSHSDIAVILDTTPTDVPERYQDPERAARLLSVVADAVPRDGIVVCPDNAHYIHDLIRDAGRRVAKFPTTNDPADRAVRAAACVATSINHTIADDARDYARSA